MSYKCANDKHIKGTLDSISHSQNLLTINIGLMCVFKLYRRGVPHWLHRALRMYWARYSRVCCPGVPLTCGPGARIQGLRKMGAKSTGSAT